MTEPLIDSKEIDSIFKDCLMNKDISEIETEEARLVEGVMSKYLLSLDKLEEHEDRIMEILLCLHSNFLRSGGGGYSFLNACTDKNGDLWTGFHTRVEQLLVLGIGISKVEFQLPREMWKALPGGMPYFVVKD